MGKQTQRVGFEVSTTVVMKSIIFWDMTPCSLLSFSRRSEEHIASIFRVEKIIKQEPASKQVASRILFQPEIPEDGGNMLLRNVGCYSTDYTASYPRR
jgi:hypothetical protein